MVCFFTPLHGIASFSGSKAISAKAFQKDFLRCSMTDLGGFGIPTGYAKGAAPVPLSLQPSSGASKSLLS